jgi:predicted dehydrogenase
VKVAVLGLGSAGARHARNLIELGHEVVGFDPAATTLDAQVQLTGSVDSAIEAADAVVVASPNSLHAEQAMTALERRRPVLVEKPLAVTAADAERVAAAGERAGVAGGVAMNLRFHPGILELKRLVDNGSLGPIRLARASFGYDLRLWHPDSDYRQSYSARAELGGGIVLDAIHELDYLLWLFGPVHAVTAETARVSDLEIDVEDVAVAALRFESGAIGAVDLNFFEPAYRRGCIVVGADAVAAWNWRDETVMIRRAGTDQSVVDVAFDVRQTYRRELVDFLRAAAGAGEPKTPLRDGVEAVRVVEAIKRSAEGSRKVSVR